MRLSAIALIILILSPATLSAAKPPLPPGLPNAFFAFDNGTGRGKLSEAEQAKMLKELGYAGMGYTGCENIPEMLKALDAEGLKMFSIYVYAFVDPKGPHYDPNLKQAIKQLKGRDTIIWLPIRGQADDGDEQAVKMVDEIGKLAAESNLRVVLYPHRGFFVETTEKALEIVKKVDRPNVGVSLNLCHRLKVNGEEGMEKTVEAAMPHLFLVSINGCDGGETKKMGWDRLIQTLDKGDYDVYEFVKMLRTRGYDKPIGLQCFAIKGDIRENLTKSMAAWKKFVAKTVAEP